MHPPIRSFLVLILPIVSILSILIGFSPTSGKLPPEIRADVYLLQVEQAIRDGDHERARTVIRKIRALQDQHELDLTDDFHFRFSKAAADVGLADLALESVVKYLAATGREGRHYVEALEVMNQARAGSSSSNVPAHLSPCILADAYLADAEQAIRDGDLDRAKTAIHNIRSLREQHDPVLVDTFHFRYAKAAATVDLPDLALESVVTYLTVAGREGQHYADALELMNGVQREVSCRGWDSEEYFKSATIEEVKGCLDAGIDVKIKDDSGVTPLHRAAKYSGKPDVIKAVLDAGAVVDERDYNQETPLHWAAAQNNAVAVKALIEAGAVPNVRDNDRQTPLHYAADDTGNQDVIQDLLNAGADVDARDEKERSPLHLAAQSNNLAAMAALIAADADLESQDEYEKTPLHYAVEDGHPDGVELLLRAGVNRARVKPKWTALHWSVTYNENPDAIRALIKAGAKIKAKDKLKWRPLHVAAKFNRNPEVVRVLIAAGADPKARTKGKWTALHAAAQYNENPNVVRILIDAGAEVEARIKRTESTPLHLAAGYNENPDVVRVLINSGAKLEARFKGYYDNYSPLHFAARFNNADVVKALIDAKADVEARSEDDQSPLHLAAIYNNRPSVAAALLNAGTDVNDQNKWGRTPLSFAAGNENPAVVKRLLQADADVNAGSKSGSTPLFFAAWNENPAVVRLLLKAGADVNARNNDRKTALHYAASLLGEPEAAELLLQAGADVNARDRNGQMPLDSATKNNANPEVAQVLRSAGATRTTTITKTEPEPRQGTDWTKVAVGVLGAAAIAHAGRDAPSEVTDQALADWIDVMTEGGSAAGTPTSTGAAQSPTQVATAQRGMEQALRNLEAVCGEKYWSGFAPNDQARFYCMAAFNDHCGLKRAQTEEAKTKLRASKARNCGVLQGQGLAGKCSYCQ